MTAETKTCQNCHSDFTIEPEDFDFYRKISVPPPTWCPECRVQRRMAFRAERALVKRKSDFLGKKIFSTYSQESPRKVYENDVWNSDAWDPMAYGHEPDFSRPFLDQLHELVREVPRPALSVLRGVNSDYSNNYTGFKNCYLVFNGDYAEDCMYGSGVNYSKYCADVSYLIKSELCYESVFIFSSSKVLFSVDCESSYNLFFSKNCVGCHDCFGCVNLRNKSYHIFNQPFIKEEYFKELGRINLGSFAEVEKMRKKAGEFRLGYPNKFMHGMKNSNVSGEYIYNSKEVRDSYLINDAENLRYCQYVSGPPTSRDCYDYTVWGAGNELGCENTICGLGTHRVKFCIECWPNVKNLEYCSEIRSSSDLFGCVGLRNKQFCILNRQYAEKEYEELREKIIAHMNAMPYRDKRGILYRYGEFYPIEFSPFAYNETIAQEYFPLTKEEALEKGYRWRDPEERRYEITKRTEDLPDHIKDVNDSITGEIIQCNHYDIASRKMGCNEQCTTAFKIIPDEFTFYRRMNLPLPRLCPNCRHYQRLKQRNPLKLWHRACMCGGARSEERRAKSEKRGGEHDEPYSYRNTATHFHGTDHCPNEFETSYSPEREEIVYCESCYNSEVV